MSQKTYEALLAENHILNQVIKLAPGHIYWKDIEGKHLGCNDELARVLNLSSPVECIGKSDEDFNSKEDADKIRDLDKKVIQTSSSIEAEESVFIGGELSTFLSTKSPFYDKDGNLIGIIGTSINITDRKKNEQLQKEIEILEHTNAMIKMWATAIAHEMRTPLLTLTLLVGNLRMIHQKLASSEKIANSNKLSKQVEMLEEIPAKIETTVNQAQHFIRMTLVKSRSGSIASELSLVKLNIADEVNAALDGYPFLNEDSALVNLDLKDGFDFMGDSDSFHHIIFNLLKNALHFVKMKDGGEITITAKTTNRDNLLIFKDTGPGIPGEYQQELFKPFFTKSKHGTGVGLTLCKNFMEAFGGEITFDSVFGEYTEFQLKFPKI